MNVMIGMINLMITVVEIDDDHVVRRFCSGK